MSKARSPRKHKEWNIQLYDGDRVVGSVGWHDLMQAERAFKVRGGQVGRTEESGTAGGRVKAYHEEQAYELKVYSQQFCRAHYALDRLAGNPIANEALRDCQRLRRTWETRRRNRLARDQRYNARATSENSADITATGRPSVRLE